MSDARERFRARMGTRRLGIVVVVLLVVIGAVWWWRTHRGSATPATSTVTQSVGSASARPTTTPTVAVAQLAITVRDAKGPIADAAVRLAPADGEVLVLRTGADGTAHASGLAPGRWSISASAAGHEPAALDPRELAAAESASVSLTLAPGGRVLSGTVTDATGGPIAGARIDAARLGATALPGRAVATVLTSADGRYQLAVSTGQLLVAASSADYAPQARYVEVGEGGATADFALVPGGVIEGVVLDERSKQPVGGALVTARRDRSGTLALAEGGARVATAAADGRFRLAGLRPGAYELGAHDATRIAKQPTLVGIGVAEQVTDVQLLIGSAPVVRGIVLDEAGAPVGGATVTANGRDAQEQATTDAKGAFELAGLAPGAYILVASTETQVPAGRSAVEVADKDVEHVEVRVRRGTTIIGHVEPRQACEVASELGEMELGATAPMMLAPASTKDDGRFVLGPTTTGKTKLAARCASGDQGSLVVDVAPGMAEVVIAVTPGASIAGRVLDGERKPVAGVTVMGSLVTDTERTTIVNGRVTSGVQAITGADGAYELKGLAAGTYHLAALDRGKPLRARGKPVSATVTAREAKTGVELVVDRPTGIIKGTVTGPDGKPLADAWVSVSQDLDAMIAGMVDHGGGERGGSSTSRMVMVEDTDEGGEGGGGGASEVPPALTDAQGQFVIGGLPHAVYQVVAEAKGGTLRGRAASISPDATVAIQALGVTTLSGTVRHAAGPVALFTVELEGPTTTSRSFTDGAFRIGRVDPGTYTVHVTSRDGNGEAKVTVTAGEPATVDIVLAANAIVVGTMVDAKGTPMAGVPVTLVPDAGDGRTRISLDGPPPTSSADGTFHLESKPGPHILVALIQPRPFTRRGLVLEAGKTLDLGRITVDSGSPPKP